jgi:Zn-dependent protease with chaperone function
MAFTVYLPLVLGIALAVVASRLAAALPPRSGVWCLTSAATVSALSWGFSLLMISFTGLGRTSFVARYGHWSADRWRHLDPVGVWAADVAGIALVLCVAIFVRAVWREAVAAHQLRVLTGSFGTDAIVVFVDDEAPHAYAVGGRRPRIVVSRGLMRTLGAAERRAVLSHESAHVAHRHDLHLRVIRLAAAVNPMLRGYVPAGVLAVERWADEETAARMGDRTLVARTLLRAALASAAGKSVPAGVIAHTGGGDVGRRVTALLSAPPRLRLHAAGVALTLLAATLAAPVYTADHLDALLASASGRLTRTEISQDLSPVVRHERTLGTRTPAHGQPRR